MHGFERWTGRSPGAVREFRLDALSLQQSMRRMFGHGRNTSLPRSQKLLVAPGGNAAQNDDTPDVRRHIKDVVVSLGVQKGSPPDGLPSQPALSHAPKDRSAFSRRAAAGGPLDLGCSIAPSLRVRLHGQLLLPRLFTGGLDPVLMSIGLAVEKPYPRRVMSQKLRQLLVGQIPV